MRQTSLEQRVAALEKQIAELLAAQNGTKRVKDWRHLLGAFTDDDVMKEIFEEGRKIREAEGKRARSRKPKKARARA